MKTHPGGCIKNRTEKVLLASFAFVKEAHYQQGKRMGRKTIMEEFQDENHWNKKEEKNKGPSNLSQKKNKKKKHLDDPEPFGKILCCSSRQRNFLKE